MSGAARFHRGLVPVATSVLLVLALGTSADSARGVPKPHPRFGISRSHTDILVMVWKGKIQPPMSTQIVSAFELNKDRIRVVELMDLTLADRQRPERGTSQPM